MPNTDELKVLMDAWPESAKKRFDNHEEFCRYRKRAEDGMWLQVVSYCSIPEKDFWVGVRRRRSEA